MKKMQTKNGNAQTLKCFMLLNPRYECVCVSICFIVLKMVKFLT